MNQGRDGRSDRHWPSGTSDHSHAGHQGGLWATLLDTSSWTQGYTPFKFASGTLEKVFLEAQHTLRIYVAVTSLILGPFISVILALKCWKAGGWPGLAPIIPALLTSVAACVGLTYIMIFKATVFRSSYNLLLTGVRGACLHMCLAHINHAPPTRYSSLLVSFMRDTLFRSMAFHLFFVPLVLPQDFVPSLLTLLVYLACFIHDAPKVCTSIANTDPPMIDFLSSMPLIPLMPFGANPVKSLSHRRLTGVESCTAVIVQLHVVFLALGMFAALAIDIYHRRSFLLAHANELGERGLQNARSWPLGAQKGIEHCLTLALVLFQGFWVLLEILLFPYRRGLSSR